MNIWRVLAVVIRRCSVQRMLRDTPVTAQPFRVVKLHRQIHIRFVVFVRLGALVDLKAR